MPVDHCFGAAVLKKAILVLIAISLIQTVHARDPVRLSNDAWPPFIVPGRHLGTAEQLVCEALERSGWSCSVDVEDWETVLNQARIGVIDGIAAAWRTPDRETFLLFSEPYLTNRIIPVINGQNPVKVESMSDLSGLRVAMVNDYAYGEEIEAAVSEVEVINTKNSSRAMKAVLQGEADVALVDELVARDELYKSEMSGLTALETVLAFRSLHLAITRRHPLAGAIIDDFHRAYKMMLADGTVNEILNVDWLASDFGQPGTLNVVLRSGSTLDDLSYPTGNNNVYALDDSEYEMIRNRNYENYRVNYQADGKSYSTLQSALDEVFGKDTVCKHKNFTSQFDCSGLFKKR